jgi:hypothetical protein
MVFDGEAPQLRVTRARSMRTRSSAKPQSIKQKARWANAQGWTVAGCLGSRLRQAIRVVRPIDDEAGSTH